MTAKLTFEAVEKQSGSMSAQLFDIGLLDAKRRQEYINRMNKSLRSESVKIGKPDDFLSKTHHPS